MISKGQSQPEIVADIRLLNSLDGAAVMGHNLWLYFGADERPCTTYFNIHQGFPGF